MKKQTKLNIKKFLNKIDVLFCLCYESNQQNMSNKAYDDF